MQPHLFHDSLLLILRHFGEVEDQFHTIDRQLLGGDARLSGLLRVSTLDAIAVHHAGELGSVGERYPSVELEVTVDNRPSNLSQRETDVVIRMSNSPPEHLVGSKLGRIEFAIYASEELIDSLDDPTDLGSYPWLAWRDEETVPLIREFAAKHAPNARHAYRVGSMLTMQAAVSAGIGVSFMGCLWADRVEGIRRIRDVEPGFGADLWILTHPDLRNTARIRAFMDHFSAAMKPYVDVMAGRCAAKPALTPA